MNTDMKKVMTIIALLVIAQGTAHASLIGDTVSAALTTTAAGGFPTNNAVVGSGVEFSRSFPISIGTMVLDLDIGADTITLNYTNPATGPCPTSTCLFNAGLETLAINDLDWIGMPAAVIADVVQLSSNWSGLSLSSFSDHDVAFTFSGAIIPGGTTWTAVYQVQHSEVPEPGSLALMALGLMVLSAVWHKRRARKSAY